MNIWWCEVHKSGAGNSDLDVPNIALESQMCPIFAVLGGTAKDECRMVQMQLVPIQQPAPYDIEIPDFVNRMDEMPHGKSFHDEDGNRPDFVNRNSMGW